MTGKLTRVCDVALRKLLIVGNYGSGNVGDEAILRVLVHFLKDRFEITVIRFAFSSILPRTTMQEQLGVKTVWLFNPVAFSRGLVQSQGVLIGGGSIIRNASLARLFPLLIALLMRNRKVVLFGAEAREISPFFKNLLCRIVKVPAFLRGWPPNLAIPAVRMPDVTFALPLLIKIPSKKVAQRAIGISIRPPTLIDRFDQRKHLKLLRDFLRDIQFDELHLIAFSPFDRRALLSFADSLRGCRSDVKLRFCFSNTIESVLAEMSNLSLAVGMRLHFLIFSSILGVPFVAIPYDEKVARFARDAEAPTLVRGVRQPAAVDAHYVARNADRVVACLAEARNLLLEGPGSK
jgi:polysaccharide pyruvyl transferase WcaK-like protein